MQVSPESGDSAMTAAAQNTFAALADLPGDVRTVLSGSLVCEYASLTKDGRPITWAVVPYPGPAGTLDVSTGLTYPDKAERARRSPRVALLYSDPIGLPAGEHPVVLVEGSATVRDADLQANTDRYVRESLARTTGFDRMPWFLVRRLNWYFARIWVQVTPERITWWPHGDLAVQPVTWVATDVVPPASDPAPRGTPPPRRPAAAESDWKLVAERAERLGAPVLTTTVAGRPVPVRARSVERTSEGYRLGLPVGAVTADGPACLTFHRAGVGLAWQENVVFAGSARVVDGEASVSIERALPDWSINGSSTQRAVGFLRHSRRLKPRLRAESARRGQAVPTVRRVR
jgi:hypothetical protein